MKILLFFISLLLHTFGRPITPVTLPILPIASSSAIIKMPQTPTPAQPKINWGTTESLGNHLYRTYVANDPVMGTPDEILTALNNYRRNHGVGTVQKDDGLCHLAQSRADDQQKMNTLDEHKGLVDYMNNPDHWGQLNITGIGENASYGYTLSGVHLIEWVFDSDAEHRDNQLNPSWNLACAGTSGTTVDVIFGKR